MTGSGATAVCRAVGGRVAQAVEDEGLTGDPPGVLEDQAGEGVPSAAYQFEAESLEALAAGG